MAKLRRDVILDGIFWDICTNQERQIVDEFYSKRMKGPAVAFQLRKIREFVVKTLNTQPRPEIIATYTSNKQLPF
ncbi:MAG: hypothetical protein V1858_02110 [Candidatus Gottesmanbacteria bacterium]